MLKSAAAVLGFLFALSTAYYLSFWGYFGIDAFQFIAVEDIIKGIAYPLRFAGAWLSGLFVFIIVLTSFSAVTKYKGLIGDYKDTLISFVVIVLVMFVIYLLNANGRMAGMALSVAISFLLMTVYFLFEEVNIKNKLLPDYTEEINNPLIRIVNVVTIYCLIFLPINAIVAGQIEARIIHDGVRYNYVATEELPKDKVKTKEMFLVFLGALSEKYIFVNKAESEEYIVDKSDLTTFKIHHFDSSDSVSVSYQKKYLIQDSSKSK